MRARWLLVLVTAPALDENNQTVPPAPPRAAPSEDQCCVVASRRGIRVSVGRRQRSLSSAQETEGQTTGQ
jgi:hypothetical protein